MFFSVVLVSVIFIGRSFSDKDWDTGTESLSAEQPIEAPRETKQLAAAGLFCVGLAATGPAFGAALDLRSMSAALSASSPAVSAPWERISEVADWAPVVIGADRRFSEVFTDGDARVDRFVALYVPRGREDNLIRSDNRIANSRTWAVRSRSRAVAAIRGESVPVNAAVSVSGARTRLVWSFYALNGNTAANLWDVKLNQVRAYLSGKACPSAFVAIAVDMTDRMDAEATLERYLTSMESPSRYLCPT
jgi:EpsI family protein